jgi:hypothetical protein
MIQQLKAANSLLDDNPIPVLWGLIIFMVAFLVIMFFGSYLGTTPMVAEYQPQAVNYVAEPVDVNAALETCGMVITNR